MDRHSPAVVVLAAVMCALLISACGSSSKPKPPPTFTRSSSTPNVLHASPTPAPECIASGTFEGDIAGPLAMQMSAVHSGTELRIEGQSASGLGSNVPIDLLLDIEPFTGAGTYPAVNTLTAGTASPRAASPASPSPATSPAAGVSPDTSQSASPAPAASPSPGVIQPIHSSVLSLVFDPARSGGFGWSTARSDGSGNPTGSVVVSTDLQTVTVTSPVWQSNLASHSDTGKTASVNLSIFCPQPLH